MEPETTSKLLAMPHCHIKISTKGILGQHPWGEHCKATFMYASSHYNNMSHTQLKVRVSPHPFDLGLLWFCGAAGPSLLLLRCIVRKKQLRHTVLVVLRFRGVARPSRYPSVNLVNLSDFRLNILFSGELTPSLPC